MEKKNDAPADRKEVERVTEYRRDTKLKSTFLKNSVSGMQSGVVGSHINNNLMTSNLKKMQL